MNPNDDNKQFEKTRRAAERKAALRKQAEEQVRNMEPTSLSAQTPEEIQQMLHELRVHQIELEMQNEELRTAQAEIEAGRARYFNLYDLAPVGYCTLSEQGLILEANLTAATLLGTARSVLVKQPISRFILKDDQDIYYLHRKKLFETGEPQEYELRLVKPDGPLIWAHLTATTAQAEDGGPLYQVVLSDISERKRSESVLAFLAQSSPNPASGDFFQVLARYISETLDMGFVCIDRLDGDNLTAHTEAVYSNGRFEDNVSYALKDTPCGEVVGKQVCCFPASIKNLFPNDGVLQQMEAESYIGVTLWSHDGGPIGLIAVIGARPMTNRPQAESLLRLVAVRAAAELERKQAEEALRLSEERFRNAFEHSAIGMALVLPEGNWLKVNKWVCDIVGYTADELMAKTFQDITHTEDLDTDLAFVRQMLAGEIETYQMEKRYFHKDGHIVWVLLTVSLVWDEQGAPLHFISQIQNITERKREQEAIRESELKFRTLVEASSSGIWKTDAAGHNTYVSPRWCEITGISEAAAAGQGWASGLHPDDRVPVHTGWMKAASASASYSAEFRFVHSDGRFVWVLCQASPVKAGDHVVEWIGTITDITERKRAEDALRSSRQLLDATEALSAVGGWEWDVATQAMTWTDGTYRIHDFDPAVVPSGSPEHIARSVACYDPRDRPRVEEAFRRCVEAGEPYDLECDFTTAKGRRLCVRTMGRAIRENGLVVKVLGNLQDITEPKRAKEEVARSTALLRDVVDMVPAYICAKNSEGRFLLVNRKLADFYGIPVDTMTGMLHADLCEDEEELRTMLAADRQVIERGRAEVILEETMKKPDGSIAVLKTYKIPFTADGKPSVLIAAVDITERKRAEETLWQSRALLRAILDNIPVRVFWKDRDLNYLGCNLAFARDAGLEDPQQLVGKDDFAMGWREQAEIYRREDRTVIETGEPRLLIEEPQTTPTGDTIHLLTSKVPLQDVQGTVIGVLGTYVDISEIKRAEVERESLQAQLRQAQKMESVGRLAGGVAHDFNNMLGIIIGHADMILEQMDPDQPFYADLTEIRKAGARSADLTRQLLAFARKQTIAPKVIDLNEAVESILKMLRRLIGEDIDLSWRPGKKVWPVNMDSAQIDQILANLCVNAHDAIAGVGKMTIETGNATFDEAYCRDHAGFVPGEYAMLAVSDNGCGMDSETMSHLFEPFFTTKELGKGTGLGLATVYGVVKQNNGLINVYSEPGQGTTFKIYLSRHLSKTVPLPEKGPDKPRNRSHETVLLVEDEPAILRMTTMMLEREGYTVVGASTPGEAIHLANEHAGDIHLLMTDVVMPEMNGRDLAKNILSLYPHLKCLFMSGYTANVLAHHGVLDESVNFIQKPFSIGELTVKVRQVLKRD